MTMPEWSDPAYQKEVNLPIETRSDLIRLLLLSKYGGIWLDADSIPLRDFTPLVRVGAVVPSYDGTIK
jgi:mannosyltransferase OCH1-like enzyme